MKTWEVMKALTEDNSKVFKCIPYNLEVLLSYNNTELTLTRDGNKIGLATIMLIDEWEEVKQPVTFMEAVNSGKKIRHKEWASYYYLPDAFHIMSKFDNLEILEMINDNWYIE